MIKLGKLTDYAIAVMGQLVKEGKEASRSANYLAEKTGVPEPTVAKVLKLLAKGNLLESARGAAGGYKLSRTPDQISMADIITVLDGPIAIVSCVEGSNEDCKMSGTCPVKGHWDPLNDAIRAAFEKVRLADMVFAPCCKGG
jgi:FeS assembly SUF system regulator